MTRDPEPSLLPASDVSRQEVPLRLLAIACLLIIFAGCPEKSPTIDPSAQPTVSKIPLRVLVVAATQDESLIARQWLADSEQEIVVQVATVDEALDSERLRADVVLFPSRLLVEFAERGTLMKLNLEDKSDSASEDGDQDTFALNLTAAERAQVSYDGGLYGLPLGISLPVVVATDSLAQELDAKHKDQQITWDQVLEACDRAADATEVDEDKVHFDALVDRYLSIVARTTSKDPTFGLLFDLETMKPRLSKPEFQEALEILVRLSQQPEGMPSVLGSHAEAWEIATSADAKLAVIASPSMVMQSEVARSTQGRVLQIAAAGSNELWNTGNGLIVGLSDDCSQTKRATEMVQWFAQSETRDELAPVIQGIQPSTPISGSESLVWNAQQTLSLAQGNRDLPREPSLPNGEKYRRALGTQLLAVIRGEKNSQTALEDATQQWLEINKESGFSLQGKYERSLGIQY